MVGEAVSQMFTPSYFIGLIVVGLILGLVTRSMGNPLIKILIDICGLIAVLIGFFVFIPLPNQNTTLQQGITSVTNLLYYFINVVIPYLIGDAITYIGYSITSPRQFKDF